MEDNKVTVRIYGQEYTISGERDTDTIQEIAAYVDEKMREISKFTASNKAGALATLACVNITDEVFSLKEEVAKLTEEKIQLENDAQHYMKLWDEAKQNFIQYKEGASKADENKKEIEEYAAKLEGKVKEFESAYFDLQMENIQLKDELSKLKR
ncbi:MAG: cell division protein ZapA [Clostridiales bacterium]|jgi:cell division protein ZapA (FtsZ GTPase activity inhibitor)|nr:cell division protein ZapA [Clostridiales bacterium]